MSMVYFLFDIYDSDNCEIFVYIKWSSCLRPVLSNELLNSQGLHLTKLLFDWISLVCGFSQLAHRWRYSIAIKIKVSNVTTWG